MGWRTIGREDFQELAFYPQRCTEAKRRNQFDLISWKLSETSSRRSVVNRKCCSLILFFKLRTQVSSIGDQMRTDRAKSSSILSMHWSRYWENRCFPTSNSSVLTDSRWN